MDCVAKIWDIQPFASGDRCVRTLQGHQHNFERNLLKCAWAPDGKRVACGSSDRLAYVWQVSTGKIEYALPGGFCKRNKKLSSVLLSKAIFGQYFAKKKAIVVNISHTTIVFESNIESHFCCFCKTLFLLGHQGSVNAVAFHQLEPILITGGSDKRVYLGEIEPSKDLVNGL
jgi:WD40 repeat protein